MQRKIFYPNPKILYSKKAKAESQIGSRKDENKNSCRGGAALTLARPPPIYPVQKIVGKK